MSSNTAIPMPQGFFIAIDGPVASGKGTVARVLAERLNGFFMNTGGMYRAVALHCIKNGVSTKDEAGVTRILPEVNVEIRDGAIFLNNEDVTERIKQPDTSDGSSEVGVYKAVREALVKKQQEIGKAVIDKGQIVVAEGRDVATRIFPDAALKIFLTASPEVRAKRRQAQYEVKGEHKELAEMLEDTRVRDERDSTREIDPLALNDPEGAGYWKVDDSDEEVEQTVERIVAKLIERGLIDDKN